MEWTTNEKLSKQQPGTLEETHTHRTFWIIKHNNNKKSKLKIFTLNISKRYRKRV